MRILSQPLPSLLALAAIVVITAAAPTEKRLQHFTIQQGDRVRAPRSPAAHYMRALRKFWGTIPDHVASAAKSQGETGTAPALPEEFDSEYLTPITVGGQGMNVAIDTGSADTWVFSSDLSESDRGNHDFYTPGPTAKRLEEQSWRIRYGDGTTASGDIYVDSITVGGITSPEQSFGAARRVSDEFIKDENNDGIMGIGFTELSSVTPDKQTSWFENVKDSLASPLYAVTLKRNAPGTFDFGYIDHTKYKGDITYSAVNNSEGFWSVTAETFQVGEVSHNTPIKGIVDTGTTLLIIPEDVVDTYYAQVPNAKVGARSGGYEFPCNNTMPDFALVINGYKATVPGEYVKYQPMEKGSETCFGGIQAGTSPDFSVFGDVLLKSHFVVFDSEGPRIGWANQA